MENIKNLLLNFTKEDYKKDINLHIHSSYSDGISTPEEIIEQAKQLNYKYIAICDHNTVQAYEQENILNTSNLITAIEYDCWYWGCLIHIIGYGIDIKNKKLLELCAKTKLGTQADLRRLFTTRGPEKVIEAIHDAGGLAILAHPACYWAINIDHFVKKLKAIGLDGIEVYYPYNRHRGIIKFHSRKTIAKIADKYNLIKTGGTDEHGKLV